MLCWCMLYVATHAYLIKVRILAFSVYIQNTARLCNSPKDNSILLTPTNHFFAPLPPLYTSALSVFLVFEFPSPLFYFLLDHCVAKIPVLLLLKTWRTVKISFFILLGTIFTLPVCANCWREAGLFPLTLLTSSITSSSATKDKLYLFVIY